MTFALSLHAPCLRDDQFSKLKKLQQLRMTVASYEGKQERLFCLLDAEGLRVYVDCVTGTMYDKISGRCLTSDRLKLLTKKEMQ